MNSEGKAEATEGEVTKSRPAPVRLTTRSSTTRLTAVSGKRNDEHSLYRELLQGLYDAVIVSDLDGNIIDANTRAEEFLLRTVDDLRNTRAQGLISGLSDPLLGKIREHLAAGRFTVLDAHCIRKDGSRFPAEIAISRVRLSGAGNLVFSVRNIEWRKQAEEKLRREAEAQMSLASTQQNFAGSLNILSIADVLQLINTTNKSGTLAISNGDHTEVARIAFASGEVANASCSDLTGDDAVLRALRSDAAAFRFRQGAAVAREPGITKSVMNYLLESARQQDESNG